jgi:hypothetical protein
MKTISLTQGQVAIVCDCHYHLVKDYKWYAIPNKNTKSYHAVRNSTTQEKLAGAPSLLRMHIVLNNTPKGFETDHINHDTLDNQCKNLRTVTTSQNGMNRSKQVNNTSGFKGVAFHKPMHKWQVRIGIGGTRKHIGFFESAEDGARAYDKAARDLFGEFAKTNF